MKQLLLLTFILCAIVRLSAQSSASFIHNQGQWNERGRYKIQLPAGEMYLENGAFVYHLRERHLHHGHHNDSTIKNTTDSKIRKGHIYKMNFNNANPNPELLPLKKQSTVHNYYLGNDRSKWASKVPLYKEVGYKNLYNNIDLLVKGAGNAVIYDIIVHSGGDINDIEFEYEGIDSIRMADGKLLIETTVAQVAEMPPFAYQNIKGEQVQVECNYLLDGKKLRFDLPNGFNTDYALVIDPTLIFSTYTGSVGDNWGFTAAFDHDGYVYTGGIVEKWNPYPVTSGAYQTTHNTYGKWDIAIMKISDDGVNTLYATYLGGDSDEMPHSLICNSFNELIILGTTGSDNFPVSTNAYDTTFNGGSGLLYDDDITFANGTDIFATKLSADGSKLLASTYIGGSGNDGINFRDRVGSSGNDSLLYNYGDGARGEAIVDDKDYMYFASTSFSHDFPITKDAVQPKSGGQQDAVVFKLDPNMKNLIWSTYMGGKGDDAAYSVDVNSKYEIYITGGTVSDDFPTTAGAHLTSRPGGTADAFLTHISQDGKSLYASTYYGSPYYDQAYFVRTDRFDHPYIYGQTLAKGNTLIKNAPYKKANSGQFIAKFNKNLSNTEWSTTFGTGDGRINISPSAFSIDICDRIYLAGFGFSNIYSIMEGTTENDTTFYRYSPAPTFGMEVSPDAYRKRTDGQDAYLMVLEHDATKLKYATFFGEFLHKYDIKVNGEYITTPACVNFGDHVDGGTSRFDKLGNIYQAVCASCGASNCSYFPAYPDAAIASQKGSYNCNNAVFRFQLTSDRTAALFTFPETDCAPFTATFKNRSNGKRYEWDFGDGTKSTAENPSHTFNKPGMYNIRLISYDDQSCNLSDTTFRNFFVPDEIETQMDEIIVCKGIATSIGIPAAPGFSYKWEDTNVPNSISDSDISFPFVTAFQNQSFSMIADNGLCKNKLNFPVKVKQFEKEIFRMKEWHIDENNKIRFKENGDVEEDNTSQMVSENSTSSICNKSGELIAYTNGETLWNANNEIFENGSDLMGNSMATQAALILPQPQSDQRYYIFTIDSKDGSNGLRYSILDMSANNGLGAVVEKNKLLNPNASERITAAYNSDRSAYWIICNEKNSSAIAAYLLDANTLSTTAVRSDIGVVLSASTGCIKASVEGNLLALTATEQALFSIMQFNNTTGTIDHSITIDGLSSPYGLEFSPYANMLYLSTNNGSVVQYDIRRYDKEYITTNAKQIAQIVGENNMDKGGMLQLAYNGNIYVANVGLPTIGKIIMPDSIAPKATYIDKTLDFSTIQRKGLPNNFNGWYVEKMILANDICDSKSRNFEIINTAQSQTVKWDFGDLNANANDNEAEGTTATHTYSNNGVYIVTATIETDCDRTIIRKQITISNSPNFDIANIALCRGKEHRFVAPLNYYYYSWQNKSHNTYLDVDAAATYTLTITDINACTASDEMSLSFYPEIELSAQITNPKCSKNNGEIIINATKGKAPYNFNLDGNTDGNSLILKDMYAGVFYIKVSDSNSCEADTTITLHTAPPYRITTEVKPNLCADDCAGSLSVAVSGANPPYSIRWHDLNKTDSFALNNLCSNTYYYTITDKKQCTIDSFVVVEEPKMLQAKIIANKIVCHGGQSLLTSATSGGTGGYTHKWYNDQMQQIAANEELIEAAAGIYHLEVTDANNCTNSITFDHTQTKPIQLSQHIDSTSCQYVCNGSIAAFASGGEAPYNYNWIGEQTALTDFNNGRAENLCAGTYELTLTDNRGCEKEYSFYVDEGQYIPSVLAVASKYEIFKGEQITLRTSKNYASYRWFPEEYFHDNNRGEVAIRVFENASLGVEISDKEGCKNTDTLSINVKDFVCGEPYIFVPNAFTPGNANFNTNMLYVRSKVIADMEFAIYDRWGEKVFESDDVNRGWDGKYKGKYATPAVFAYYLQATCHSGETYTTKGNITVIR